MMIIKRNIKQFELDKPAVGSTATQGHMAYDCNIPMPQKEVKVLDF